MERRNDSTTEIETREFERLLRGPRHFSTVPMTKASLDAITREDLIAFHDKYYYSANFILAAAMNPCVCGYYGDKFRECTCSPTL